MERPFWSDLFIFNNVMNCVKRYLTVLNWQQETCLNSSIFTTVDMIKNGLKDWTWRTSYCDDFSNDFKIKNTVSDWNLLTSGFPLNSVDVIRSSDSERGKIWLYHDYYNENIIQQCIDHSYIEWINEYERTNELNSMNKRETEYIQCNVHNI